MRGYYTLEPLASITEVSGWLSSLKLLLLNIWPRINPTGQVWSTYIRVDAASWWSRGQYKYTAILRGHEKWYGELKIFASVYFTCYAINGSIFNRSGWKFAHIVQVPVNVFTGKLQGILGSTSTQVRVLVDNGYDIQGSVLYCKSIDIK